MPLVDVEQGSADWLAMRVGIVTGSRVADVMKKLVRKEGEAADRRNYRAELVCECLTGLSAEHYISKEMKWGLANEIFARTAYEFYVDDVEQAGHYEVTEGDFVQRVGFALHPKIARFGASPDALVGKDGVAEFKCPTTATHIGYITEGIVPPEYHWQMFAEMACSGRQWCDFVSFDPRLPKKYQLFVRRLERDNERIAKMEAEVVTFLGEVDAEIERLKQATLIDLDGLEGRLRASLRGST